MAGANQAAIAKRASSANRVPIYDRDLPTVLLQIRSRCDADQATANDNYRTW